MPAFGPALDAARARVLVALAALVGVLVVAGCGSEVNRRRRTPGNGRPEAVIDGSRSQLRPVLMVVIVAALGMLPAMLARGIGSDIQRPLATVVGGLASTLILTPLALPVILWLVERLGRRERTVGAAR